MTEFLLLLSCVYKCRLSSALPHDLGPLCFILFFVTVVFPLCSSVCVFVLLWSQCCLPLYQLFCLTSCFIFNSCVFVSCVHFNLLPVSLNYLSPGVCPQVMSPFIYSLSLPCSSLHHPQSCSPALVSRLLFISFICVAYNKLCCLQLLLKIYSEL